MSETTYAENVAGIVLDRPYADPDADLAVLARQFLRSREEITYLRHRIASLEGAERERCAKPEWVEPLRKFIALSQCTDDLNVLRVMFSEPITKAHREAIVGAINCVLSASAIRAG